MRTSDLLDKAEKLILMLSADSKFGDLVGCYKSFRDSRRMMDRQLMGVKKVEEKVKEMIGDKLKKEELPSVKTTFGTVYTEVVAKINTQPQGKEALLNWLRESVIVEYLTAVGKPIDVEEVTHYLSSDKRDNLELLLAKPFSEPAMRDHVGDGELPPGLEWFRKVDVRIRTAA